MLHPFACPVPPVAPPATSPAGEGVFFRGIEFFPNEPGIPFGDNPAHQVAKDCHQIGDGHSPAPASICLSPVTNSIIETDHLGFRDFAELHNEVEMFAADERTARSEARTERISGGDFDLRFLGFFGALKNTSFFIGERGSTAYQSKGLDSGQK